MKVRNSIRTAGLVIALLAPFAVAHAQLSNLLQGAVSGGGSASANTGGSGLGGALAGALTGGGQTSGSGDALSGATSLLGGGGAAGGLGGASSLLSGSGSSNVAGLLSYCIKNNYLGGATGASSVQSSLMSKLGVNSSDSGYQSGASGMLQGSSGASLDLGGSLKAAASKQVCNQVLSQAKGLL